MRKKPHILHLMATEFVGGPEKQVLTHLRYVDRDRFEISVGSYLENGRPNSFLRDAAGQGMATLPLYQHMPMDPRLIWDLRGELARREIDALITHGYKSNVVGHLAAGGRIPQAMYVRGWTSESQRVKLYHWLERRVLPRANLVVTVAEEKRSAIEALGISPEAIRVIVNAVEDTPLERPSNSLRNIFNIGADTFLLLAAGRLSPEKGHRGLVEAIAACRSQGMAVACVIFGEGPEEAPLRRQIAGSNLEDYVQLAGFNSNWKAYLPEADGVVNPSRSEVMPNVVLEAMMYHCPVVATEVGGVPELIPNPSLGITVPPGDPRALAQGIQQLGSGEQDLKEMGNRAHAHVVEKFTFEAQAEGLHALYQELLTPAGEA